MWNYWKHLYRRNKMFVWACTVLNFIMWVYKVEYNHAPVTIGSVVIEIVSAFLAIGITLVLLDKVFKIVDQIHRTVVNKITKKSQV